MSKSKPLKLIIDTNLWVSFIISNKQNLLDPFLFGEEARLLFSAELITEFSRQSQNQDLKNTLRQMPLKKCFQHLSRLLTL